MAIQDTVDLSEDQHAEHDTLRAFLTARLSSAELREALDGEPGYRPELHAALAGQLGLSGWTIPEEFGGSANPRSRRAPSTSSSAGRCIPARSCPVRWRPGRCWPPETARPASAGCPSWPPARWPGRWQPPTRPVTGRPGPAASGPTTGPAAGGCPAAAGTWWRRTRRTSWWYRRSPSRAWPCSWPKPGLRAWTYRASWTWT